MDATTKPKTRPIASSELQLPLQLWRDLNWVISLLKTRFDLSAACSCVI